MCCKYSVNPVHFDKRARSEYTMRRIGNGLLWSCIGSPEMAFGSEGVSWASSA